MTTADRASSPSRSIHHVIRHPTTSLVVFSAAAVVTLVGTFMPWLRSGATNRSSYDLLGMLRRLGIAPNGVVSTFVHWWPVVPLLITAAVVAAWWRWTAAAAVAAAMAAIYSGVVAIAMIVAARRTIITVGSGPWVCIVGDGVLLTSAAWMSITNATRRVLPAPGAAPLADRS
jgi:hypothetical protein